MEILRDIVISILTGYLAFTNFLAYQVGGWLGSNPDTEQPQLLTEEGAEQAELTKLPSRLGSTLPDILLKNTAYQQASLNAVRDQTEATTKDPLSALVNIYCTFTTDKYIRTTTGTGFFIDPDGVIITNAHVAQFLLLGQTSNLGEAECLVRNGDPAAPRYKAELLYLPPAWVQENAGTIRDDVPMGTGERDYALLYVNQSADSEPLPALFPALAFHKDNLPTSDKNSTVTVAGYPATNLFKDDLNTYLTPKKADSTISELYTFGSNFADVFAVKGSIVGAEGSSGGPVLNDAGEVIGMIVTRGDDTIDGTGSLRAITFSHIERTITEETGFDLLQNINGNLSERASLFSETLAPFLIEILDSRL